MVVCWSVLGEASVTAQVVALVLSLGLATVSYHSIEQPVLHSRWLLGGRRAPARAGASAVHQRGRVVAVSASALVVLVAATLTVVFPPGRLDAKAVAAADAALRVADGAEADTDPLTREIRLASTQLSWPQDLSPALDQLPGYLEEQWSDGCFDVGEWNASTCRFGARDAERRAVVLGDSIAGAWLPGLRAGLEPQGWSVQTLTMGQCPNIDAPTLYRNRTFVECAEHRDWALQFIAETKPDLVVLSDTYDTDLADPAADKEQVWRAGLTTVVERVRASGARVVLLTAPPAGASLQTCATPFNGPVDCIQGPPGRFRTQLAIESDVAAATGAAHVDPERWFCIERRCPAVVGATPVFADGLHMTAEYARKIGPAVVEAVLATTGSEGPTPSE